MTNTRVTTHEWGKRRKVILARDGGACQIRSPGCTRLATEVDHIIPRSRGGSDHPSNLRASCSYCNASRYNNKKTSRDWFGDE